MEQFAREITKGKRKPKEHAKVYTAGIDDIWAMDLADMREVEQYNDGYKMILCCVDCFSRYAWCVPLKTKNAQEVWEAFAKILREADSKPNTIWVDRGTEFYNSVMTAKLKDLGIGRYSTYMPYKVSIAERFIKTLKHKFWFHFMKTGGRKWIDVLDKLVAEYNEEDKHTTLKMRPEQARDETNERNLLNRQYPQPVRGKPKFKLNEWVRVSRTKGIFEKGFHPTWSFGIFRIIGINHSKPVMYQIEDYYGLKQNGSFYESELQKVADANFWPVEKVLEEKTVNGQVYQKAKIMGYEKPAWVLKENVEKI